MIYKVCNRYLLFLLIGINVLVILAVILCYTTVLQFNIVFLRSREIQSLFKKNAYISVLNNINYSSRETSTVFSSTCNCNKSIAKNVLITGNNAEKENLCSFESSFYGERQRIISYSLYEYNEGKNQEKNSRMTADLLKSIGKNLVLLRQHFPGWLIRVYSDLDIDEYICGLTCRNAELQWCDIRGIQAYGNLSQIIGRIWRFLPLADPTVEMFLSRDLDSFLSLRDAAAVQDWLQNTTKPFTTFRDHKDHNYPILAGLFGARTNQLSEDFRKSKLKTIISLANKNNPNTLRKIYDQEILRDVLFMPNLKLFVTYDSYSCETWAMFSMVRPFPTKRNGTEFLGSTELWEKPTYRQICPVLCRPAFGKAWKNC